jgi:hypothetical protein
MTAHDSSRLRTARWCAPNSMRASTDPQRTQAMGFRREEFANRPVIGMVKTWSEPGYVELFRDRVLPAHEGCDFVGFGRRRVPEAEIF